MALPHPGSRRPLPRTLARLSRFRQHRYAGTAVISVYLRPPVGSGRRVAREDGLYPRRLFHAGLRRPVGFRILDRRPEWMEWLILQNTNAYEEGFTAAWDGIRHRLWKNRGPETEAPLLPFLDLDGIKLRIPPRPHRTRTQFLRARQPHTLIFWGQRDIFFTPEGVVRPICATFRTRNCIASSRGTSPSRFASMPSPRTSSGFTTRLLRHPASRAGPREAQSSAAMFDTFVGDQLLIKRMSSAISKCVPRVARSLRNVSRCNPPGVGLQALWWIRTRERTF